MNYDAVAEIAEFCRFLEPTADETAARRAATERVSSVVTAIWPTANVQVGLLCPCRLAENKSTSIICLQHCHRHLAHR